MTGFSLFGLYCFGFLTMNNSKDTDRELLAGKNQDQGSQTVLKQETVLSHQHFLQFTIHPVISPFKYKRDAALCNV